MRAHSCKGYRHYIHFPQECQAKQSDSVMPLMPVANRAEELTLSCRLQTMTGRSMSGSFCTSTCLGMMWNLGTSRQLISYLQASRPFDANSYISSVKLQGHYFAVMKRLHPIEQEDCICHMLYHSLTSFVPCRYAEKQVGYMACAILLNEVSIKPYSCLNAVPQ